MAYDFDRFLSQILSITFFYMIVILFYIKQEQYVKQETFTTGTTGYICTWLQNQINVNNQISNVLYKLIIIKTFMNDSAY